MIEAIEVSKQFDDIKAVDNISARIKEGNVFGLVGTNGAGKSTFLRLISGILKPDTGKITIDGMEVYENVMAKELFFYISDEQFFFNNSTPKDLKKYYSSVYKQFDGTRFDNLINQFELKLDRKINTFSKGMKKQLSVISGICANTKYLFCDETFDGLDPVMRQAVKSIFAKEVAEREMTPIIASHNLRELEDICDHVGLLHKGGILLSKDIYDLKCNIHKVQCVFKEDTNVEEVLNPLNLLKKEQRGSLYTFTIRGTCEDLTGRIESYKPIFLEVLPLSLEEIFISETEVVGYDIKKLIL
ncbi:MAG TPA: ABC transporter ATP-binding protein [Lachnospiraceae bacterium]|nr:ABC transporter ATP-binding protein [Lachnospiraceae bacterium]